MINTPRRESSAGKAQDVAYRTSSFNPDYVARLEAAMSWDESAKNVQKKMGIVEEKPYRGHSDSDTSITQRIANATFQPENDSNYRQQKAINDYLKEQARQLKEDAARATQYAKELKKQLSAAY